MDKLKAAQVESLPPELPYCFYISFKSTRKPERSGKSNEFAWIFTPTLSIKVENEIPPLFDVDRVSFGPCNLI